MAEDARWAYFDYAAATPPDPRVVERYAAAMLKDFANSGASHGPGRRVHEKVEAARARFADCIGAAAAEVVFTSGATEADNLALKGAVGHHLVKNPRIVTVQTEHKAVLDPLGALAAAGIAVEVLPVLESGLLDLERLGAALEQPATLVSVMAVNNETGVCQNLTEIAALTHAAGARLHVDAAQALGKLLVDVRAWDADMVSFSGHKVYAPQGIGALYLRRLPKMRVQAQIQGGGQQGGRRSGTLPAALVMAFADAVARANADHEERRRQVEEHARRLLAGLPQEMCSNVALETVAHVPHILSIDTREDARDLLAAASAARLALAAGSTCRSDAAQGSHVLEAMGLDRQARQSLRVSLSHLTRDWEMARLLKFLHGRKR